MHTYSDKQTNNKVYIIERLPSTNMVSTNVKHETAQYFPRSRRPPTKNTSMDEMSTQTAKFKYNWPKLSASAPSCSCTPAQPEISWAGKFLQTQILRHTWHFPVEADVHEGHTQYTTMANPYRPLFHQGLLLFFSMAHPAREHTISIRYSLNL